MQIPSFILKKTNISTERIFHFYVSAALWIAAYTLFAYTIVIFLNERLQSELWVGIFLGLGSAIAIMLDIPFGYLQKVFKPRTMLTAATIGLILTVGIFLFAYQNILFIFVAAVLYGVSHDLYDVTMLSYIFNNSLPAQYGQNISQRSVAEAMGIVVGLIFSGFLLAFGPFTAQLGLIAILIASLFVVLLIFDKDSKSEEVKKKEEKEPFTHTMQILASDSVKGLKTTAITVIDITEKSLESIKQTIQKGKIILKPLEPSKEGMAGKMWAELKESFAGLGSIVSGEKFNFPLMWGMIILLLFSFWDTFVITFEPLFLAKFLAGKNFPRILTGGIIMTLFILPLFGLLIPFSKMADKYGRHKFMIMGLCISGVSLFFFGQAESLWFLILMGMTNSVGYAAVMPSAQAWFAEKYNEHVALSSKKDEIDANNSAAPLKMLVNLGNVFGQATGGLLIWMFGFNAFFIIFGIILFSMAVFSIVSYRYIKKPPYVLDPKGALVN